MNESKVSTHEVLNGGAIELWKIEGLHYVKSIINGAVKFSECVSKCKAEFLVWDAVHHGDLDF